MSELESAVNIMLDLEAMGKRTSPAITEIAAVVFDLEGSTHDVFYRRIDLQSSIDAGLTIDASTVKFWMAADAEAKASWFESQHHLGAGSLYLAISDFIEFISEVSANESHDIRLWGNGTMADNRWILSAAEAVGLPLDADINPVISHWQHTDVRTFMETCQMITNLDPKKTTDFTGVRHNPIDDCKHQIKYVSAAYKLMKKSVD